MEGERRPQVRWRRALSHGAVRGFGRGWCRTTSSVRKRSRHAPPAEANDGSGRRCGVRPASTRQQRRRHMLCAELRWRPAAQRRASVRASQAAMYCGIWMRACCATSRSVMSLTAGVSCVAHGHGIARACAWAGLARGVCMAQWRSSEDRTPYRGIDHGPVSSSRAYRWFIHLHPPGVLRLRARYAYIVSRNE